MPRPSRDELGCSRGNTALAPAQRRGDALAELIRVGHAHIAVPDDTTGADRYTLNITATLADLAGHRYEQPTLGQGLPVSIETATRIACDCSIVRHVLGGAGEILDIGRKTRVWNAAQRRAIRRRDRNRCRFPGCRNRIFDVHHIRHWTKGGVTSIDNGCLLCTHHHKLVHEGGWTLTGDPAGDLTFDNPYGLTHTSPMPSPIPRRPAA